ncbi:hypothetical protein IT570_00195 [Candidatus Sumerlaeota bacterium]|nr:hypothetical protein [Candidatus Sumerlaeota bacterium]
MMKVNESWILKTSEDCFLKRIEGLDPARRRIAHCARMYADPQFFARQMVPDHCRLPFADFHRTIFEWHGRMGGRLPGRRGMRCVLAAPRGCAKSTITSLILVLHDIVFRRERYIVLISATDRQARQRLRAIGNELRGEALRRHLPARAEIGFTARSLTIGDIQVEAFGAGAEMRGLVNNGFRPTKIILDDAEASRSADSPSAREKLSEWFAEVVEHLGDVSTNILAIGTVLHEKGLIASLLRRADYEGVLARSIEVFSGEEESWNEWRRRLLDFSDPCRRQSARDYFLAHRGVMERGTRVIWREKEDYEELYAQLTLQGRRAFYQEKQNTPLGPQEALFVPERALRAVTRGDVLEIQSGGVTVRSCRMDLFTEARRFGYLDAAMGKGSRAAKGDYCALATVVLLPDNSLVLESLWARRASPTEQVTRLFDVHHARRFERLAIEGTGFQELLTLPIEEERKRRQSCGLRHDLPVGVVMPRRSKAARISALEPLLANGVLALSPDLDEEFWEELSNWPRTQHDDALDAAAGAVELAMSHAARGGGDWEAVPSRSRARTSSF